MIPDWRTSTWIYSALVVLATVAEVIYATSAPDLQGHALAWLIVASVVFAMYRGLTRDRRRRD